VTRLASRPSKKVMIQEMQASPIKKPLSFWRSIITEMSISEASTLFPGKDLRYQSRNSAGRLGLVARRISKIALRVSGDKFANGLLVSLPVRISCSRWYTRART